MPQNKRLNRTTYEHRFQHMAHLLAKGLSTMQVVRIVCQQWGISERTAMRYLKDAKKLIDSNIDTPIRDQYNYVLNVLKDALAQAALNGDVKLVASIAAKYAKIASQAKKDLAYDTKDSQGEADFIGFDSLDEFLRSFEEPRKNKPTEL